MRHIHFTAHLQIGGGPFLQSLGDAADGPHVGGHILPHLAVPPGGGPYQLAVLILQAAGQPVDLDLHHVLWLDPCVPHTAVKVPQFVVAECIQQALHFDRVGHLGKAAAGGAAHVLGGGIGGDQLRVLRLDLTQLPHQVVVLEILQLGGVLVVVQAVVVFDDPPQLLCTLAGLFQFHHRSSPSAPAAGASLT